MAYTVALARSGVAVHEGVGLRGLVHDGGRVTGVDTERGHGDDGDGGAHRRAQLAEVGRLAGTRIPAGGVRHQVAVTEPIPTSTRPGYPWSSTWPPASTGGPKRAACSSA